MATTATRSRRRSRRVTVETNGRDYAVGILSNGRLTSIVEQHIAMGSAMVFANACNRLGDTQRIAVILPQASVATSVSV